MALASLAGGAVIGALVVWTLTRPAPQPPAMASRLQIVPPPAQALAVAVADRSIALSPDGQYIVYRAGVQSQLVVRAIDRLDGYPLPGIVGRALAVLFPR